jgi:NAD(P)-dependent dehydrogenase (short-subunit alcohol dehydrogenase family)
LIIFQGTAMANVLVLGASRGIGLEFVQQYRAAGERVIATARDEAGLTRLRELGAETMQLDVTDPASINSLAQKLQGEKIDIALYVAGVLVRPDATTPPTREDFDHLMHTNVFGAMQAIPQIAPLVGAAGGTFAFVSSTMGRIEGVSASNSWVYRVSKAALNMAVASAQHNYPRATLVALSPGWVQTDMGGSGAAISAQTSVTGMRSVVDKLTPADRGGFVLYDGTRYTAW